MAYHEVWLTAVEPDADDGLNSDAEPALKPSNTFEPGAVAVCERVTEEVRDCVCVEDCVRDGVPL